MLILITAAVFYTRFANYFDFSSGTVPVTEESEEDQKLLKDYPEADWALKVTKEVSYRNLLILLANFLSYWMCLFLIFITISYCLNSVHALYNM